MGQNSKQVAGARFLITAAGIVIVLAGMRAAESVLVPFLVSAFLALISTTPVFWLQRKGVPAPFALLLVVLGVIVVGGGIAALIGTSIDDFSLAMPRYEARLREEIAPLLAWFQGKGVEISHKELLKYLDPVVAMGLVETLLRALGGVLTNTFLILLAVIFILLEASTFPTKVHAAFGDAKAPLASFSKMARDVNHYLAIKTSVSLITGIAIAIWVAMLGVDFPILWGLLGFLLNFVPNLGSIIAAVPAVLLGFIQFGVGQAALVALGYVVVNVVIGNVIEPRLMGRRLGLSTLVVFLSLVFWGWLWGPVGMLLSVPLTMVLKIALENSEDMRWIAILLGSEAAAKDALSITPGTDYSKQSRTQRPTSPPRVVETSSHTATSSKGRGVGRQNDGT